MYCRVCGATINDQAEVCINCGCRPLNGFEYCQNCGVKTTERQELCVNCGCKLKYHPSSAYQNTFNINPRYLALSPYYQQEFTKIENSNETYKGQFNWCAFLFSAFWAISKGLWLSAIVCIFLSFATMGVGGVVFWFIYGMRGNYMYYCKHAKNQQCIF